MQKIFFIATLSTVLFSSCIYVNGKRGNGHIVSKEKSVNTFTDVEVGGAFKVYLIQGAMHSVVVEADENLQKYIAVKVENGKISIRNKYRYSLRPSRSIKIFLTSPVFNKLKVSGAVDIIGQGKISGNDEMSIQASGATNIKLDVDVPKIFIQVSGAGEVKLTGETRDFEIKSSGASEVRCFDLKAENVQISISGAGDAQVYASVLLDVKVSGAGSVKYKGSPSVKENISGAGSVKKVD